MEKDAVRAADGGASGFAALDDQRGRFAVRLPHVGVAHQNVGNSSHKWKQTIFGIFKLPGGTFDCELVGLQLCS